MLAFRQVVGRGYKLVEVGPITGVVRAGDWGRVPGVCQGWYGYVRGVTGNSHPYRDRRDGGR